MFYKFLRFFLSPDDKGEGGDPEKEGPKTPTLEELAEEVKTLKADNESLKKDNDDLKSRNEELSKTTKEQSERLKKLEDAYKDSFVAPDNKPKSESKDIVKNFDKENLFAGLVNAR